MTQSAWGFILAIALAWTAGISSAADLEPLTAAIGQAVMRPPADLARGESRMVRTRDDGPFDLTVTTAEKRRLRLQVDSATVIVSFGIISTVKGRAYFDSPEAALALGSRLAKTFPGLDEKWQQDVAQFKAGKDDDVYAYEFRQDDVIRINVDERNKGQWYTELTVEPNGKSAFMVDAIKANSQGIATPPHTTFTADEVYWAFSPDGKRLLVGRGKVLEVLTLPSQQVEKTIETESIIRRLWTASDGNHVIVVHAESIAIWSLKSGKKIAEDTIGSARVQLVSPRGNIVALKDQESLRLVQLPGLKILKSWPKKQGYEVDAISPNNRYAVVDLNLTNQRNRYLLDLKAGGKLTQLKDSGLSDPNWVDDKWYFRAHQKIVAVDPATGAMTDVVATPALNGLSVSADGRLFAGTVSGDEVTMVYVMDSQGRARYQLGPAAKGQYFDLAADGKSLVFRPNALSVFHFWDLASLTPMTAD